jgi:hypothetical protein
MAAHTAAWKKWRVLTFVLGIPALVLAHVNAFGPGAEHPQRPPFVKYEYLRIRSKVSRYFEDLKIFAGYGINGHFRIVFLLENKTLLICCLFCSQTCFTHHAEGLVVLTQKCSKYFFWYLILDRHWTYPFFEDIISYPLSRPKKGYNILSYITAKKRIGYYILYPYLQKKSQNFHLFNEFFFM